MVWLFRTLFTLLDSEEEGLIDLEAFVSGCMQMYGPAKSMQMAKVSYENRLLRQYISEFRKDIAEEFAELRAHRFGTNAKVPSDARIAPKLAKAMASNTHIHTLSLVNSNLHKAEGSVLAASLAQNNSVVHVNVENNSLDSSSVKDFATNLLENPNSKLESLRFSQQKGTGNFFGRPVEEAFGQLLDKNETLLRLGFSCDDAHWRNHINRALLRNNDFARRRRKKQAGGEEERDSRAALETFEKWPIQARRCDDDLARLETFDTVQGLLADPEARELFLWFLSQMAADSEDPAVAEADADFAESQLARFKEHPGIQNRLCRIAAGLGAIDQNAARHFVQHAPEHFLARVCLKLPFAQFVLAAATHGISRTAFIFDPHIAACFPTAVHLLSRQMGDKTGEGTVTVRVSQAQAQLSMLPAQGEVARWIAWPAGMLARWQTENMLLVQGFLLFLDLNKPFKVTYSLSVSSITSVDLADENEVAVPCLSIQIIVGGRQEAVHLRLADGPMATSWLRRLEVAMEVTKFTQTYLPLSMLSKTLEAWQLCNASSCAMADSQRQQDWSDLCSYVQTCAVRAWLMRRVSCRLNGFLHRICRLSDRRGTSVVLASLGALHLARMRLCQRRVLQAFRALQRKEKGLSALQLCRWERDFMKSLLHCWFRAVEHNLVQGEDALRRSQHLSWEIPLAAAAFHAWFRASSAAVLDRKQADLDVQLEKNVALLEDCQEVPVEMALRRMVRAVLRAQSRLQVHAYLALRRLKRRSSFSAFASVQVNFLDRGKPAKQQVSVLIETQLTPYSFYKRSKCFYFGRLVLMALHVKILLAFLFTAARADFDALLVDDCTGEECQVELRQLRGVRSAKEIPDKQEPETAVPENEATPAAAAPESPATQADETAPVVEAKATCTSLKNHDSFSSAKVGIGTPPQYFELVADTGSDNVIVQSCICKEQRFCPQEYGKCFRGTGRSSTFHIEMAHNEAGEEGLKGFVMSFGSGDILVVKSSDKVEVGDASAFMNQSLLLMVKQDLRIRGQFEGILGLGRPHRGDNAAKMVPGFMKLAGIERFSMCFNDEGPGVLGFNEPRMKESLQSVGSVHWGLDFRGITVGENAEPLSFCQEKKPDMDTACGLIPDSGTTLITGPQKDIEKLYEGICLQWPRCKDMHKALQAQLQTARSTGAQRNVIVGRMRAMLQAGSADIIHVYHDDEPISAEYYDDYDLGGGPDYNDEEYETAPEYDETFEAAPEYDENFEAAPDYYEDLGAAPYDGSGPYDVGGPGPPDYQKGIVVGPYDGPGPEYTPGPQGPGGPEPMHPKPDEYSGPGPQGPDPEEYAPEGPETEGPGPGYEAPENEEPEPADDVGPGPTYGGDLRVGYDETLDIGPDVEVEEVEGEAEPMEPTEPMEPESQVAPEEEAGATVEIPDAGGVPESEIPTDSEEVPESSAAQPGLPGLPEEISLASTFVLLIKHCYTWLGNSTDLNTEMPDLSFKVAGMAGGKETLKLDPNSYTFLTTVPILHKEVEYFLGYLPVEVITVRNEQVCLPAFSSMNYTTPKNGPVWIMGTPLFYSYKVQYDREPEPPTMSFGKGCGTCHDGKETPPSTRSAELIQQATGVGRLRRLKTPPVTLRHGRSILRCPFEIGDEASSTNS
eukprot:s1004_g5.t1